MINAKKGLNIETFNILLIFVGFPLFTTFVNSGVGSIAYRGVAMLIGIVCILKNGFHINGLRGNNSFKLFLILYSILTIKMVYEFYFGEDAMTRYTDSRNFAMIFTFGIGWIPFLGAVCGFEKIDKQKVLIYTFFILIFLILMGIVHREDNTDLGRVSLNARQSTLAFGDNGAYLSIISACIVAKSKQFPNYFRWIAIFGILSGLYGTVVAGSRGPLVSCLAGLCFVFLSLGKFGKLSTLILVIVLVFGGVLNFGLIEQISPTMANRINNTIEDGDTSGRDVIFEEALDKIESNLFWGSNPLILEEGGTFTGYHNVYLGTGVGLGLIGFIIFLCLVISVLYRTLRMANKQLSPFNLMILGLFWFYAVRGITGVGMLTNTMYTVLFAYTCIILHKKKQLKINVQSSFNS